MPIICSIAISLLSCNTKPQYPESKFAITEDSFKILYTEELNKYNEVIAIGKDSILKMLAQPDTYQPVTNGKESFMNEQWSDDSDDSVREFEMLLLFNDYEDVRERLPIWVHTQDSLKRAGQNLLRYRCGLNFWCASAKLDTMFKPFVIFYLDSALNITTIQSDDFDKFGKRILK